MKLSSRLALLLPTWMFLLISASTVFARGDKVVPQVADGNGSIRTVILVNNLSPVEKITKIKVLFFRQDGSAWSLATNQGTVSEVTLNLGRYQTIRIETKGTTSPLTSGYAIIRNTELSSFFAEDFEVALTVFYEVLSGSKVVDTVSVPVGRPTLLWAFPVDIDVSKELLTGLAIVNLANSSNKVTVRLWQTTTPSSSDSSDGGVASFTLNANEQRAEFLTQKLFSSKTTFSGMLVGTAEKPVAILALLQSQASFGLQYATLAAEYLDGLRTNTYMYLRQGFPLDADIPVSDYFKNEADPTPWDLFYESQSDTARRLAPKQGALFSVIGSRTDSELDGITLDQLQGFVYSASNIDLSDGSSNLAKGFAFAIKTALGHYVKVRISEVFTREGTTSDGTKTISKDLALEIYVYR